MSDVNENVSTEPTGDIAGAPTDPMEATITKAQKIVESIWPKASVDPKGPTYPSRTAVATDPNLMGLLPR